jgi:hypothetical protein
MEAPQLVSLETRSLKRKSPKSRDPLIRTNKLALSEATQFLVSKYGVDRFQYPITEEHKPQPKIVKTKPEFI